MIDFEMPILGSPGRTHLISSVGNDHHMPWIGAVACLAFVLTLKSYLHTFFDDSDGLYTGC